MKPRSRTRPPTRQTGYALILMVLALMGIGGGVIASFTQGVMQETERERYLHNQRILEEAKQALLQFAYNYPVLNNLVGPGRLPNPDTNNNGISDGGNTFGRLPWNQAGIDLYDIRDADGERLWYAVSSSFIPQAPTVNSQTSGTMTLRDQSGNVLFDGSNPGNLTQYGVAAVIIAPGAPIDRAGVVQNRAGANVNLAVNYLDRVVGTEDNADFTNGSAVNGLILGPVNNLINDQFIVITAAEVIAMAEKATLQAYRDSINAYLGNVGCIGGIGTTEANCLANGGVGWNPVYPWLYNYRDVANIAELSSYYPAFTDFDDERDPDPDPEPDTGYLDNYGRIPSIFADYFTEADGQAIDTWLSGSMTLIAPGSSDTFILTETDCEDGCPQGTGGSRDFVHDPDPDVEGPTLNIEFLQILTDVGFVDIDPGTVGNDVRISATFPTLIRVPFDLYFWGDDNSPGTDWTACPDGADQLSDCEGLPGNRSILHLEGKIDFGVLGVESVEEFDFDNDFPPTIAWFRASDAAHARITGTYPSGGIVSFPGVFSEVTYEYDGHWDVGEDSLETDDLTYAKGDVDMSGFSLASLTLGMRYFPELPAWALSNGWHDSIRMAYADTYLPTIAMDCVPLPDADNTNDCLSLPEERGAPRNIASLLVIAGQHDWDDADIDLSDVFDNGNSNNNRSFYNKRSISPLNAVRGNDKILVIDEL